MGIEMSKLSVHVVVHVLKVVKNLIERFFHCLWRLVLKWLFLWGLVLWRSMNVCDGYINQIKFDAGFGITYFLQSDFMLGVSHRHHVFTRQGNI